MCAWNKISKSILKQARTPNHEITTSLGMIQFWEIIQCAVNSCYRNLYVKDSDASETMSVVMHYEKHHLNYKVPADNLRLTRHISNNRSGMVINAFTLTGTNLILSRFLISGYEKLAQFVELKRRLIALVARFICVQMHQTKRNCAIGTTMQLSIFGLGTAVIAA